MFVGVTGSQVTLRIVSNVCRLPSPVTKSAFSNPGLDSCSRWFWSRSAVLSHDPIVVETPAGVAHT